MHAGLVLTLTILGLLCALQALALLRAPAAWLPAAITVTLAPGASIVLGQRELAAPHAEREHLSLRRDPIQGWMVSNLSTARQVLVQRGGSNTEQRIGSAPLNAGDTFQIDAAVFKVSASDAHSVSFSHAGRLWRYDGATLYRDRQPLQPCPATRLSGKASALWNRMAPNMLTIARPLYFGGNLVCGNRLGVAGVVAGAAQLSRQQDSLQLSVGQGDGVHAIVQLNGSDLRRQEAPLADASALIAGHTRFGLTATASTLRLTPGRHVSLYYSDHGAPELPLAAGVQWDWQQRSLWSGGADFAWGLIMLCAACLTVHGAVAVLLPQARAGRRLAAALQTASSASAWLAAAALLAAGLAVMLAQRAGLAPPAALSMLLGACALLLWLLLPQRLTLLSAAAVILLAVGLLTQLELGLGAPQTAWLRYYQKSAALLAIGCGLAGLLLGWRKQKQQWQLSQRSIEIMLAVLAAVALAALAAQVLWGDEGGVFDLQPVELAKLALVALSAHCLALRFGWHSKAPHPADLGLRWLRLAAPVLLFLALLGMALVQVDDFSPLILLLVWSGAMLLAYALIARHHLLTATLAATALLAVLAVVWLRWSGSEDLVRWGFYADRFLVWLNPAEHPHTGQQLLLGARAVSEGGWLGADHVLGLRSLGQSAGNALLIPAVQDDFAASFFLYRHGLLGALLLWGLQATFLTGVALAALHAWHASSNARNFRQAWSARYRYFALCGGGAFVLGHLLLSWGTNLAIFPIMGQPMSFLSAGGSHLLFFLLPLLAFSALSTPSIQGE